jgi:cysteine desulfurase family protein
MRRGKQGACMDAKTERIIYLDHAATSWPKPPEVIEAVREAMVHDGANPGRGSHRMAVSAGRIVFEARKALAELFRIANPNDIALTFNTTIALNMAIKGCLKPGDHVVATAVEHNAVRRPLEHLKRTIGVKVTYVETDERGRLDPARVREALLPDTKLVIVNHSSNLLGSILPVAEIGTMTRKRGIRLLVDAAQSAGILPIDVEAMGIDLLAFPGHKGLLGPQGTGGLYIHPEVNLEPILHGGTGSQSEAAEQPDVRPDRYESGTVNTPGLAGLAAGVRYILHETVEKIHNKEWSLAQRLMEGLSAIGNVRVLGPEPGEPRTGIVSFIIGSADPSETAFILDRHYGIAVRAGFHCTPLAHGTAGTAATGAVRASVGHSTTEADVDALIAAAKEISRYY